MSTEDSVTLLGTKGGPAIRAVPGTTVSMPTANLVSLAGENIVVDCGLGVTRGLVDAGLALRDLSVIFVSHLHSDHYLELGPLLHTAWTAGLKSSVTVYGPAGLAASWDAFLVSMQADIDLRIEDEGRPDLRDLVGIRTIEEGEVCRIGDVRVDAIRTIHPPLVDTFALRFDTPARRVVLSGDTAPLAPLEAFARDADLLVHEAMLEAALPALLARIGNGGDKLMTHWLRSHTFAHDAARTAQAADAKRLALSHLIPSDDPAFGEAEWRAAVAGHYDGDLIVARDGLRVEL